MVKDDNAADVSQIVRNTRDIEKRNNLRTLFREKESDRREKRGKSRGFLQGIEEIK